MTIIVKYFRHLIRLPDYLSGDDQIGEKGQNLQHNVRTGGAFPGVVKLKIIRYGFDFVFMTFLLFMKPTTGGNCGRPKRDNKGKTGRRHIGKDTGWSWSWS